MDDTERKARADRYRALAKALGLSLEGLARRLDISLSSSNRYASGKTPVPSHVLELIERWLAERGKRPQMGLVAERGQPYRATKTRRKK